VKQFGFDSKKRKKIITELLRESGGLVLVFQTVKEARSDSREWEKFASNSKKSKRFGLVLVSDCG
jgi:hypothetical protein